VTSFKDVQWGAGLVLDRAALERNHGTGLLAGAAGTSVRVHDTVIRDTMPESATGFFGEGVWARFLPREPWRRPGDRLDPALAPVLLDEVAWWLGALVTKEGGLTNRISVTLLRPDAVAPGPITAIGRFADVTPVDRRRVFWRTRSGLLAADGTLLASATIVFRPGVEYSERQMSYFRSRTDPEIFARMFPTYAG